MKKNICHNCKYSGENFEIVDKFYLHCEHPKYTDNKDPWETLKKSSDTCKDYEFKNKEQ